MSDWQPAERLDGSFGGRERSLNGTSISTTQIVAAGESGPRFMDWGSLDKQEPPARTWFVNDWLTTGATLLAGAGGAGKSLIAQSLATALATKHSFIGDIPAEAVSLMWACEDDKDELWRRQRAICSALGVSMPKLEDMFYLVPRYGCDNALFALSSGRPVWTPAFDLLRQQVQDTACDLLWLDNIAHVFGADENNRHHVTSFVNEMLSLRPMLSLVLLGHPAKTPGSEFSGSTAWENAARMRWYLGSKLPGSKDHEGDDEDNTVRYLCRRKANYTSRDYCRLTYTNGVLLPDLPSGPSFSSRYGAQERAVAAEQVVLDGFERCKQSGITPSDSANAQDYLPRKLIAMGLNEGHSKEELARAMGRLMASGTFVRGVVGQYPNRTPRYGLVRP